jgi:hypothetical protein
MEVPVLEGDGKRCGAEGFDGLLDDREPGLELGTDLLGEV